MTELVREAAETVEHEGTTYEIVPPRPATAFSVLTPRQRESVRAVYEIVARALPLEGRDYEMEITFGDGGASSPRIRFSPMNELGAFWCGHLSRVIPEEVRRISGEAGR